MSHHNEKPDLSEVERGKKNLSLYLTDTIARGFHLSLAELLHDL